MMTKELLARVLAEEFAVGGWAPTETILLWHVAEPQPENGNCDDVVAMDAMLQRVVDRLNTEES